MTLGDMKSEVLRLIEEINEENEGLTDDPDFKNKINNVLLYYIYIKLGTSENFRHVVSL